MRFTAERRSPLLSPADMIVIGAVALLFFGPDQLPKVARNAGKVIRDVQATSQSFIREMERAADEPEHDMTRGSWAGPPVAERYVDPAPPATPFAADAELITPYETPPPETKMGESGPGSAHHGVTDVER